MQLGGVECRLQGFPGLPVCGRANAQSGAGCVYELEWQPLFGALAYAGKEVWVRRQQDGTVEVRYAGQRIAQHLEAEAKHQVMRQHNHHAAFRSVRASLQRLCYRDSIVLLLRFLAAQSEKAVTQLDLVDIDPPGILAFLSYLEKERKNGVSTRNVRLSAIHALFRFIASRNPEYLELAQRVIDYLEYEEIDSILQTIDRTTTQGARDYADEGPRSTAGRSYLYQSPRCAVIAVRHPSHSGQMPATRSR